MLTLHPHQEKAVDMLRAALKNGKKRPVLYLPTGAGKTVIAANIIGMAIGKGKRICFTAPLLNLIDQTVSRFVENGIYYGDIGVIQGDHPLHRPQAPIQVASVQTLSRRYFPDVDLVIVDECHIRYRVIEEWMDDRRSLIFIGLSASPFGRGMAEHYDDLIVPTTIRSLIDGGYLSKFKTFCPTHPDLSGVKIVGEDYHEGQLSERMSKKSIVGDVVQTWLDKAERRPTLVFAVDCAHANLLFEQFAEEGVACAYVDAKTPREDRIELGRQLNQGHLEVICSVGTMTHGVDLDVRCIVLARPTRSEQLFVQMIGRGLRIAPGKDHCLILDHSDSTLRLGMVTDIQRDHLLGGKNAREEPMERKTPLPYECPKCSCLIPPCAAGCPHCGFKPKRASTVVAQAGELVEYAELAKKLKRKTNGELTWPEKEELFGELKGYALVHGYKSGWAANKYRDKCGVWPNDPRVRDAAVRQPSAGTSSWIRAGFIRWAKSKPQIASHAEA